jgi:hypothetical protein
MPNPWLNEHKSTAAMNYFFSNMTNTVIFMTLGDKAVSVRSYTTTTHYITLFTCIHKYEMKTHPCGVFPDGCSGHLPPEILGDLRNRHTTAASFRPLHIWWRNQRNLSTYIESNSYCVSNNIFNYNFFLL